MYEVITDDDGSPPTPQRRTDPPAHRRRGLTGITTTEGLRRPL